jgi:hypothetical protein
VKSVASQFGQVLLFIPAFYVYEADYPTTRCPNVMSWQFTIPVVSTLFVERFSNTSADKQLSAVVKLRSLCKAPSKQ